MTGFLGTRASSLSDVALILMWVFVIVAVVGAINGRRRRISKHCPVMATAAMLNWIPILLVMIPKWLGVATGTANVQSGFPTLLALGHGILGSVTQLLATYTVTRMYWIETLPPKQPIWLMRTTITLWLVTILGGTTVYLTLYVR